MYINTHVLLVLHCYPSQFPFTSPPRLPSSLHFPPLPVLSYPLQFAHLYADNVAVTVDVLKHLMAWPLKGPPTSGEQLKTFEVYHEMIDLYLWLG